MPAAPLHVVWLEVNCSYAHASIVPALLAGALPPDLATSWTVVRGLRADSPGDLARRVVAARPDVVAGTLYLFNRATMLETLARVRALLPECPLAVGGPECLGDNRELLERHPVDAAFRGEGEVPFGLWLRRPRDRAAWAEIPGLCHLGPDGGYRDDGTIPRWPGFAASRLDTDSPLLPVDRPFLQYETARGCAGRCAFCTSGDTDRPRPKPLATVAAELAGLRARGVRDLRLLDRTFNLPPSRCVALLRMFRDDFPDLRFHLEIHPGLLAAPIREELARARPGQLHVEAGVQSLSPAVLARVGRPGDPEEALEGLSFLLSCRQFETHVDLLAGLPGQDLAGVLADAARLVALGPAEIQLEVLKILPGTRLCREAAREGLVFSPLPPYEVLRTPRFPEGDLARAEQLSRLLDRFHNPPVLRSTTRILAGGEDGLATLLAVAEEARMLAEPVSLERRLRFLAAAGNRRTKQPWLAGRWCSILAGRVRSAGGDPPE